MKLVTAIIKPSRLDTVLDAMKEIGVSGMTVTEVRGFGRQKGKTEVYRGAEYEVKLLPKVKVEILAAPDRAEAIAEQLATAARTGKIGDGKIWVTDLEAVMRIRTGEMGQSAVSGE
jgi:nitrogen regulatory protein P-II 2